MNKRPRTELEAQFLGDNVYSAVANSRFSKLPVCKFALGYFLISDFTGRINSHISNLPGFFGYLQTYLNNQNFRRFVDQVKSISDDQQVFDELKSCFRNHQIYLAHENGEALVEGVPCKICFPASKVESVQELCKKFVEDFTQHAMRQGKNFSEIYSCICKTSLLVRFKPC